jgi:hypothetical protein
MGRECSCDFGAFSAVDQVRDGETDEHNRHAGHYVDDEVVRCGDDGKPRRERRKDGERSHGEVCGRQEETMPTARFQPMWRLGSAAYWLVRPSGWSTRYESDRLVTVSTRPSSSSLGGATGTSAKKRKPIRPR